MEVTRIGILEEMLRVKEAEKVKYSHWHNGLAAEPGYEAVFSDRVVECGLIRDMIQDEYERMSRKELGEFVDKNLEALKDPKVQGRLREWQKVIMDGGTPDVGWAEEGQAKRGIRKIEEKFPGNGQKQG